MVVNLVPGPGSYSPDKPKKNNSQYSFGIKSNKELRASRGLGPSPGDYEMYSFLSQTHGVGAFGKDTKLKLTTGGAASGPGPGAYNSHNQFKTVAKRGPNMKFGSSPRNGNHNKTVVMNP